MIRKTHLWVASNNCMTGRSIERHTCVQPVMLGLCPKRKNHPLCGWIFIADCFFCFILLPDNAVKYRRRTRLCRQRPIFSRRKNLYGANAVAGECFFSLCLLESLFRSRQFSLKIVIFVVIRLT